MNPPEPREIPVETEARPNVPTLAEALNPRTDVPTPRERRRTADEEFSPRYVEVPRGHDPSQSRNLAFGSGALFLALLIGAAALFIVGPRAILALSACLVTALVLHVLARLGVFREAHGAFLALGLVCLVGAVFAMGERVFHGLDGSYWMQLAALPGPARAPSATTPAPERGPALLTDAFALATPDAAAGPRAKVLKDSRVVIEGRPFQLKTGEIFALAHVHGEKATLKVRDLHIDLPVTAVEILEEVAAGNVATAAAQPPVEKPKAGPAPEPAVKTPVDPLAAQLTKKAQDEAVKRYPALGIEGSRENSVFVATFKSIKDSGDEEFFKNAEWPLELAELLAKRQGWTREDIASNRPPPLPPPPSSREPQLPVLED